jgi:hypothetical protein
MWSIVGRAQVRRSSTISEVVLLWLQHLWFIIRQTLSTQGFMNMLLHCYPEISLGGLHFATLLTGQIYPSPDDY